MDLRVVKEGERQALGQWHDSPKLESVKDSKPEDGKWTCWVREPLGSEKVGQGEMVKGPSQEVGGSCAGRGRVLESF